MSAKHIRLRKEANAIERFTYWSQRLNLALAMNEARRNIDPIVECMELHLANAGNSVLVDSLRSQLAEAKRTIAARGVRRVELRVVN